MEAKSIPHVIITTSSADEAVSKAREHAESGQIVVACGGDGSVHYVASGFVAAVDRANAAFSVLPAGTGNDFARMIGMPTQIDDALDVITTRGVRPVDYGVAAWKFDGEDQSRPFFNCAGIGLDAKAALLATRLKPYIGNSTYLVSPALTLLRWSAPQAKVVTTDDSGETTMSWRGPFLLASVANGKWIGGGIKISPEAQIDDGKLDLCLIRKTHLLKSYILLAKASSGGHAASDAVTARAAARICVELDAEVPVYVDGEPGAPRVRQATFDVKAGNLPTIRP